MSSNPNDESTHYSQYKQDEAVREKPLVSVLMSVYNGAAFLEEAIKSILAQTYRHLEFVIIDDGSTDSSAKIIEGYSKVDPRIKVIKQQNQGLVAALNTGLEVSTGNLIARMDADDISIPTRLEKQVDFMLKNPHVLAVGSTIRIIDSKGGFVCHRDYPVGIESVREKMMLYSTVAHPAIMMRREPVLDVGGYREICRHAEDYDLWLRLLEVGEMENIPEPLLFYRQHETNVTLTYAFEQLLSATCSKLAHKKKIEIGKDLLEDFTPPLSIQHLEQLGGSEKAIRKMFLPIFRKLVKQKEYLEWERITAVNTFDWLKRNPRSLLKLKNFKAFIRFQRKLSKGEV